MQALPYCMKGNSLPSSALFPSFPQQVCLKSLGIISKIQKTEVHKTFCGTEQINQTFSFIPSYNRKTTVQSTTLFPCKRAIWKD